MFIFWIDTSTTNSLDRLHINLSCIPNWCIYKWLRKYLLELFSVPSPYVLNSHDNMPAVEQYGLRAIHHALLLVHLKRPNEIESVSSNIIYMMKFISLNYWIIITLNIINFILFILTMPSVLELISIFWLDCCWRFSAKTLCSVQYDGSCLR